MTSVLHRRIRSFVRREGRLTDSQQRALDSLWARYGLDFKNQLVDLDQSFGRCAPKVLEIGFGDGESLLSMAQAHPEQDFIGIEVHRPGVGHLLQRAATLAVENLRVYCHDAVEVLEQSIPEGSLQRVQIFFPDPWHKKRHHKRRLVQLEFVQLLATRLHTGGQLHMATDWEPYAQHMLEVMQQASAYRNCSPSGDFIARPDYRPLTKFEQRGLRLGHGVWDLLYVLEPSA